jgi:serine/threonine protein phosphatase PrpC
MGTASTFSGWGVEKGDLGSHLPDTLLKEEYYYRGSLSPAQHLPQKIGAVKASTGILDLETDDILLVSSDGLHHEIPEEEIGALLTGEEELAEALKKLVAAALDAGGRDNITIVAARIG